ncbi:hypothetical protein Ndes2437B_g05679 [Nannochloris sp. 'desiccata']
MGSGRDKRKKAKGTGGEDDIDALLAQFKLSDEAAVAIQIDENCPPPSPRVYSSFQPLNEKEIIMFGGEWYDGERDKMHVYADIYIVNPEKLIWKKVTSPGGPLPRTAHQAVVTRAYMYIFGGEFTSLNQTKFKHYGDLWRLDLSTWKWEQLPSKGGPSPRSGHRMVLHKGKLILFGGFFDSGKETRYYNDLWSFDLEELKWKSLGPTPGQAAPPPRGGCQLALHPESNTVFMVGGFSIRKNENSDIQSTGGKFKKKGGMSDSDDEDGGKGIIHDDVWALDLKNYTWEKVKKAGMAPTPRTSFGLVTHKTRAVFFGGVHDREGGGDRLYSELFNEAYQFNMVSRRWFPLAMRPPKKTGANNDGSLNELALATEPSEMEAAQQKELPPGVSPEMHAELMKLVSNKNSPLVQAATRIQAAYRGHMVRSAMKAYKLGGQISELLYSPASFGIDLSAKDMIKPRARSAPMLAVLRHTLWMWGGMVEIGHTDVVLDDLWSVDLNKLDGWKVVKENTAGEDAFKEWSEEEEEGWETE